MNKLVLTPSRMARIRRAVQLYDAHYRAEKEWQAYVNRPGFKDEVRKVVKCAVIDMIPKGKRAEVVFKDKADNETSAEPPEHEVKDPTDELLREYGLPTEKTVMSLMRIAVASDFFEKDENGVRQPFKIVVDKPE